MKLSDIPGVEFRDAGDFDLQDPIYFASVVGRMIEDVELASFMVAKLRMRDSIDESRLITLKDVKDAISLIESEVEHKALSLEMHLPLSPDQAPKVAVVDPDKVKKILRSPLEVAPSAIDSFARYINYTSVRLLYSAAEAARAEELSIILPRHFLSYCDYLPYPLNLLCKQAGSPESRLQEELIKYPAVTVGA